MQQATIQVTQPRLFNLGAVLIILSYGILLVMPLLVSFVAISVIPRGLWTALIPILTLAATAWFVPLGQGNRFIAARFKSFTSRSTDKDGCLVQLSLAPRIRRGLRATIEDADDFGFLTFGEESFSFDGDSVQLSVPYTNIRRVSQENVGLRGRFVCGSRITVEIAGIPNVELLQFAERSSAFVPQSKRITRALLEKFQKAAKAGI